MTYDPMSGAFALAGIDWAKSVHRGDFIGMPGRWLALLAGLSMICLSVSGIAMWRQMWRTRSGSGPKQIY